MQILLDDLIDDEGFRATVYDDKTGKAPVKTWKGKLTVLYGFNVEAGGTKEEGRALVLLRISSHLWSLSRDIEGFVTGQTFPITRILVNLAYNKGHAGLLKWRIFIDFLMNREFEKAKDFIKNEDWSKRIPRRAKKILQLIDAASH